MRRWSRTRSDLLSCREQASLAARGRDLLKDKRDELLEELRRTAGVALSKTAALAHAVRAGRLALALAEARDGPEALASAALGAPAAIRLRARVQRVMGVRLPQIEAPAVTRPRLARGYGLIGTSPEVDEVAERFETQLARILEMASVELRLRRLAEEVRRATMRVDALELRVIPELQQAARRIEASLEEREREEHFRLKRAKARRRRRDAQGGTP